MRFTFLLIAFCFFIGLSFVICVWFIDFVSFSFVFSLFYSCFLFFIYVFFLLFVFSFLLRLTPLFYRIFGVRTFSYLHQKLFYVSFRIQILFHITHLILRHFVRRQTCFSFFLKIFSASLHNSIVTLSNKYATKNYIHNYNYITSIIYVKALCHLRIR